MDHRIPVDGGELHCTVRGDGPPVLFIHGFPLDGTLWHPTAERLAGLHRSIMPDLRGHGRSSVAESMTIARYADDLVQVLDALAVREPVVVVGLSMGGIIAFDLFRRHRARLRALGIVDARANEEPPEGVARRHALADLVLREGSRAAAEAMIGPLFAPGVAADLRRTWYDRMAATPPAGVAAAARALAAREDSRPTLPRIDCPTLVVAGEQDAITPVDLMREIHAQIGGSRFALIPGAGHLPPVEQPDRFARVLLEFLRSLPDR